MRHQKNTNITAFICQNCVKFSDQNREFDTNELRGMMYILKYNRQNSKRK